MNIPLPVGKLPVELLARILSGAPVQDPRLRLGPGIGLDCAVLDFGDKYLVIKSDPITFATEEIGWYLVQVNANDLATTGATPRWLMVTALLPEAITTPPQIEAIFQQIYQACRELGITVVGGHTEITHGLERPILLGTLLGEVARDRLVTPQGARPGDRLLLTKGVPIEATALLAREMADRLAGQLNPSELKEAQAHLYRPGISVVRDAQIALSAGEVHAMHDPTEGGMAAALWEMVDACNLTIVFHQASVPVPPLPAKICQILDIDPFAAIASGALLIAAPPNSALSICSTLTAAGIRCEEIGSFESGPPAVWEQTGEGRRLLPRPVRDEVARLFGG